MAGRRTETKVRRPVFTGDTQTLRRIHRAYSERGSIRRLHRPRRGVSERAYLHIDRQHADIRNPRAERDKTSPSRGSSRWRRGGRGRKGGGYRRRVGDGAGREGGWEPPVHRIPRRHDGPPYPPPAARHCLPPLRTPFHPLGYTAQ